MNELETTNGEIETDTTALALPVMYDENWLGALEFAAERSEKMKLAMTKLLVSKTYPEDWHIENGKACLGWQGIERVWSALPKSFHSSITVMAKQEEKTTDSHGDRLDCRVEIVATIGNQTYTEFGRYSSRNKLYKRGDSWQPLSEIPPGDIFMGAFHNACGNAYKRALGINGIPERVLVEMKIDVTKMGRFDRQAGSQGGAPVATGDDATLQKRLRTMLLDMSNGDAGEAAKLLESTTEFTGKDGKQVAGRKRVEQLTGKWLGTTYGKIKEQYIAQFTQAEYDTRIEGEGNGAGAPAA